jgi:predicted nucleic acid-binding protein
MIVVDTNVLVYLTFPTRYTDAAKQLLVADDEWAVPVLWQSEYRNVLAQYLRQKLITYSDAIRLFEETAGLVGQRVFAVTTIDVLELIQASSCSAYDCEYVALARALKTRLVTMDKQLINVFPETAERLC